jgi:hypothetical protein
LLIELYEGQQSEIIIVPSKTVVMIKGTKFAADLFSTGKKAHRPEPLSVNPKTYWQLFRRP